MGVSLGLRLVVIVLCIAFFVLTIRQIKNQKLLIRYSLLWFAFSIAILVTAVFPEPVFGIAQALGFDAASNFVFAIGFFFVLAVCLTQSRAISKQVLKTKRTVQCLALLENRLAQIDRSHVTNPVQEDKR